MLRTNIYRQIVVLVAANVCGPSRAALMAGRYPMRCGHREPLSSVGKGKFSRLKALVDLRDGQLRLIEVVLALPAGRRPKAVDVKLAGNTVKSYFNATNEDMSVMLQHPLMLEAGQQLDVQVEFA